MFLKLFDCLVTKQMELNQGFLFVSLWTNEFKYYVNGFLGSYAFKTSKSKKWYLTQTQSILWSFIIKNRFFSQFGAPAINTTPMFLRTALAEDPEKSLDFFGHNQHQYFMEAVNGSDNLHSSYIRIDGIIYGIHQQFSWGRKDIRVLSNLNTVKSFIFQ